MKRFGLIVGCLLLFACGGLEEPAPPDRGGKAEIGAPQVPQAGTVGDMSCFELGLIPCSTPWTERLLLPA